MEIAGVDYPERAERFDVVYCLLSLTRTTASASGDHRRGKAGPEVTGIWPVAGWLEREVYDMYGVLFEGNTDLRRILTDYGFAGHPQRKDFPLTGYVELRYSEEPSASSMSRSKLAQDFRTFDFMSPWEGAEYILPGDEKAHARRPAAPTPRLLRQAAAPAQPQAGRAKTTADHRDDASTPSAQDPSAVTKPKTK
jgi:NADH-quinone oxidoreductase subunit C